MKKIITILILTGYLLIPGQSLYAQDNDGGGDPAAAGLSFYMDWMKDEAAEEKEDQELKEEIEAMEELCPECVDKIWGDELKEQDGEEASRDAGQIEKQILEKMNRIEQIAAELEEEIDSVNQNINYNYDLENKEQILSYLKISRENAFLANQFLKSYLVFIKETDLEQIEVEEIGGEETSALADDENVEINHSDEEIVSEEEAASKSDVKK